MKHAKREKMRFGSKMALISCVGMTLYTLMLFTLAIADVLFDTNVQMPSDWNGYVFAFLTVEIVSLAALRLPEKVKSKYEKEESEERHEKQIDE